MNIETRKQLEREAEALALSGSISDEAKILLAILAAIQGIDYKLWQATKGKANVQPF